MAAWTCTTSNTASPLREALTTARRALPAAAIASSGFAAAISAAVLMTH